MAIDLETRVTNVEDRVSTLAGKVEIHGMQISDIKSDCAKEMTDLQTNFTDKLNLIARNSDNTLMILKYVVLPLIVILGGLIGVKIALPEF